MRFCFKIYYYITKSFILLDKEVNKMVEYTQYKFYQFQEHDYGTQNDEGYFYT